MLSRIAESLFWIGRYIERADGIARILDVQMQRIRQLPDAEHEAEVRRILRIMGVQTDENMSAIELADELAWNKYSLTSIAGSVTAARENARRARETVSPSVWESLNTTYYGIDRQDHGEVGTYGLCHWVTERIATVRGKAELTMSHDETKHFLDLGQMLERADMVARLLWIRTGAGNDASWTDTLHCAGAYEAFLRSQFKDFTDKSATEFLLLDRLFPNSILYSLTQAEAVLDDLDPGQGRLGFNNDAKRILDEARSSLEYNYGSERALNVGEQLNRVQTAISEASSVIHSKYFSNTVEDTWFGGVL